MQKIDKALLGKLKADLEDNRQAELSTKLSAALKDKIEKSKS